MLTRIGDATIDNIVEPLDEVIRLLLEIKSGWDSIPQAEVDKALELQAKILILFERYGTTAHSFQFPATTISTTTTKWRKSTK